MTNILILGHKGMLGHMVYKVLSDSYEIKTINERFPNWNKELFNFFHNLLILLIDLQYFLF